MFENLFNRSQSVTLDSFLDSTDSPTWDYLAILRLRASQLHTATHDQIMDNPGDVAIGVNRVEVVLGQQFFGMFGSLVIKHLDDGSIYLMFNNYVTDSGKIISLFNQLKSHLGGGVHYEPKFASFNNTAKVISLASGKFDSTADELLHVWLKGRFSFTLNYKIEPFRQLLFKVTYNAEKLPDTQIREKGTLLDLLTYDIFEVFNRQEDKASPMLENGLVKFVDYTFHVNPPELGLFELIEVRIFGTDKSIAKVKSLLVIYKTKHKPRSSEVIQLVDRLVKIYGPDGSGYAEMQPHEIDMVDDDPYWTGRSWFINQYHGLQDMNDPEQRTLYWICLALNPEDGLNLSVLGFDDMIAYHMGR